MNIVSKSKVWGSISETKRKLKAFIFEAKHTLIKFYEGIMKTHNVASKRNIGCSTTGTNIIRKEGILNGMTNDLPSNFGGILNQNTI